MHIADIVKIKQSNSPYTHANSIMYTLYHVIWHASCTAPSVPTRTLINSQNHAFGRIVSALLNRDFTKSC